MKVVGVMPAYNEATRITQTVGECLSYVDYLVVVDDGSPDGTWSAIKNINDDRLVVLQHRLNRGQGAALRTGTEAALRLGADVIVHLDADGQHNAADTPRLIEPIISNTADVVFGSRFMGMDPVGMPRKRRLLMRGIKLFNAFALGIPKTLTDPQSGFRAMSAQAARKTNFKQDRMAHASEILRLVTRSDLRWMEVPALVRYTEDSLRKGQKSVDALKITWQFIIGAFTS